MPVKRNIFILIFFLVFFGCSKKETSVTTLKEKNLESQMIEVYYDAMREFERGDVIYAGRKFSEVELLYPQSIWAPKAVLMSAYGYFSQGYYNDAIINLERFLVKYKCHYDQIVDEKKDLKQILRSRDYFERIVRDYPDTEYAYDSRFKLDLIREILASKEMYLARYYVEREKWIPAINRFKIIIKDYDNTIYVEEALHRLVELHYRVGLIDEAEKYAKLLGYNYKSSKWYENSYSLFDKTYKKRKKERFNTYKKKSGGLIKKFKTLLE